uniref:RNA polymerase II subunit 5-mediating protein homolog n=1 Tax=Kalanchoe fedtschenkoi TaxID=63787 RepID=A0A7N0U3I2_KALFE
MDGKGTVTPLSSMFSPEEANGAARRVDQAIAERTSELHRVRAFLDDNSGLAKLVQRLPDQLHHDIMVPFGKGAFFPGRLIHTNEFLVLLGEGYYADRTSKQTVEILDRRGKELESQMQSLKAMIKDLKAESSFFGATATEAAEGLVEIREEYVEQHTTEEVLVKGLTQVESLGPSENQNIKESMKNEDFARIMARMEELEKAELAAEGEDNYDEKLFFGNDVEKAEEDEILAGHGCDTDSGDDDMEENDSDGIEYIKTSYSQNHPTKPVFHDPKTSKLEGSATSLAPRGQILLRTDLAHGGDTKRVSTRVSGAPKVNENLPDGRSLGEKTPAKTPQPVFDSQKAFTGSVVEHPYNLHSEPKNQAGTSGESAGVLPTKPVSRFKMQRK